MYFLIMYLFYIKHENAMRTNGAQFQHVLSGGHNERVVEHPLSSSVTPLKMSRNYVLVIGPALTKAKMRVQSVNEPVGEDWQTGLFLLR